MSSEITEILGQGTFGCTFKTKDEKFITKIQEKEETSKNETLIGRKIMTIKNYDNYFAPILQTENIDIKLLDDDEVDKCEIIHNNKDSETKYESEKIKYIGKDTLSKYYLKIISNKKFINVFIENHISLLEALEKLISAQIIHYDLKENNVMIQDTDKRPIIIDFGLSIDVTKPMENFFYSYYTEYAPWCIDIIFLSYMVNKVGKEWQTQLIRSNNIKQILDEFFKNNPINTKLLIEDERNYWKSKLENYFNVFINKPWKILYDELVKYCFTWDNYSISVMYLFMIHELELLQYSSSTFLNDYINLLKTNIMSIPNDRKKPTVLKNKILKIFNSIQRIKVQDLKKILVEQYRTKEVTQKIEKNMAISIIEENKTENVIYKNQ